MRFRTHLSLVAMLLLLCAGRGTFAQPTQATTPTTQPWQPAVFQLTTTLNELAARDQGLLLLQGTMTDPKLEVHLYKPTDLNAVPLVYTSKSQTAYLGVGVERPSDTLRAQLVLPQGAGLVVNYVDDKGPANGPVSKHDVLQKLDDQIVVNAEQLIALVRMHKPGDTVSLTLIREAKPQTCG